ncbi:histidine phosphatase family protein [Chitinimonas lacunae]|uniref:Histidine phosphatase family protein n=1 Tax=Chitinimonas lacunae TaxID=1963018 RepID=A0ABV8MNE1_9NEIS
MPSTHLVLIRHGETAWNVDRRFQGHLDIGLNDNGRRQAELLALRLEREHARQPFAALYCSDLSRARDTAAAIAARTGLTLTIDAGLRERGLGVLEGLTPDQMAVQQPEVYAGWQRRDPEAVVPGGERLADFSQRVLTALQQVAGRHDGATVLVVVHGGVLDCIYRAAQGIDLMAPRQREMHNAAINRLVYDGTVWSITDWGDVSHLDMETLDEL